MSDSDKELAARRAVEYVVEGMVVGLGTGSTADFAIRALGERARSEGLDIRCVPTSAASARLGEEVGLSVRSLEDNPAVDLTIDGADEFDPGLDLIKGLGGALLREKIVAGASDREVIIVDASKRVERLGTRSPLPVEVVPFAWTLSRMRLMGTLLAPRAELRRDREGTALHDGQRQLHPRLPLPGGHRRPRGRGAPDRRDPGGRRERPVHRPRGHRHRRR